MSEEIETITKKFLPGKDAKETIPVTPFDQGEIRYKYKGIYNMKYGYEVVNDGFVKYERYTISLQNNE
jgi:hypothetical protein